MKNLRRFILCLIVILSISISCMAAGIAASEPSLIKSGYGLTIEEQTIIYVNTRTQEITSERNWSVKDGAAIIAEVAVKGTFHYDGTSVRVVSKELTKCEAYDGWRFSSSSLTASAGTITFSGTLAKGVWSSQSIVLTLSCDKNGIIT